MSIKYVRVIKFGAIVSTFGVILLILFGLTLLLFPVVKVCEKDCNYISKSPDYLKQMVLTPLFLFISLIFISLGVFLIRIGNWKLYRTK